MSAFLAGVNLAPDGRISVRARIEASGVVGHGTYILSPGDSLFELPYEVWRQFDGRSVTEEDLERAQRNALLKVGRDGGGA